MRRTLLICCLAMLAQLSNGQKVYFIYLQAETGEPFFVRMNERLYSSASSGYLVLSKLKDSTYNFKLGFPGKDIDADFSVAVNKKDHGYLIKNLGEKGWALFDLQTLGLQMSSSSSRTSRINYSNGGQVNAFTDLLAKAADDPTLKQTPVFASDREKKQEVVKTVEQKEVKPEVTDAVVKQEKQPETIIQLANKPAEQKPDTADITRQKVVTQGEPEAIAKEVAKSGETKTENPGATIQGSQTTERKDSAEIYKMSMVAKVSENTGAEGIESVFLDRNRNGVTDTVRILIPAEKSAIVPEQTESVTSSSTRKFLELKEDSTRDKAARSTKPEGKVDKFLNLFKRTPAARSSKRCPEIAVESDFLKLRRRMAGKTNDDEMIAEARKYFKTRCFTTEQVKNLSSMFLSNAGKFNFFNAARDHVSDPEQFSSLQSEFKDDYYVKRFQEMQK